MDIIKSKPGLKKLALFICLGIISAVGIWGCNPLIESSQFLPGVEIGSVPVQGLTPPQAAEAVERGIDSMYTQTVVFYKDDQQFAYKLGDLCVKPDVAQVVNSVWEQERERSWQEKIANLDGNKKISYPVNIAYDENKKSLLVQEWNAKWGIPPQDASLEVNSLRGLVVIPGKDGFQVDQEKTFQLPAQVGPMSSLRLPITFHNQMPVVGEEQLKNMGELAVYSTNFNVKEINRSYNLALAADHINKVLVPPGGVFSMNDTVGERSVERGFRDAKIIVGDKFEQGLGGGVCQVSSTLYNACLLAGMEIVERGNHNLAVAYVPLGLDATVAWGSQDFRFRNSTTSPLYIRSVTANGTLTVNIYGDLQFKRHVGLSYVVDETIPYVTIVERDLTLAPGEEKVDHYGQPGYVVRSYRTFYDQNGQVSQTELLARDYYKPLNKLVYSGPDLPPAPITEPAPVNPNAADSGTTSPQVIGSESPRDASGDVPIDPLGSYVGQGPGSYGNGL